MTGDRVASRRANFEEPTSICVGALFLAACLAGVCIAYAVLSQHGVAGWDESYGYSGSLDTHLCYAAWRSSYSSRASIGV